jgi:hypothetical protein
MGAVYQDASYLNASKNRGSTQSANTLTCQARLARGSSASAWRHELVLARKTEARRSTDQPDWPLASTAGLVG